MKIMKKIFSKKRILYILLPVLALAFIAGVPVNDDKTLLEELIAAFPSAEADAEQQEKAQQSLDEVWAEIEKLSEQNGADSQMLSGKVALYDNLDDNGVKEQQRFTMQQAGDNQWFHLDSFDRVQYEQALFMIDHTDREITVQMPGAVDSMMNEMKMMDPAKFKKMLVKDGTTAEITRNGAEKTLTINPGLMDAVNRYEIVYDSLSYRVKKFRIYYTSIPYQNYFENEPGPKNPVDNAEAEKADAAAPESDEPDIDADITEYVLEFEIDQVTKGCDMIFTDNIFFKVDEAGELTFTGKFSKYKKTEL
jgi:hypothetical protein